MLFFERSARLLKYCLFVNLSIIFGVSFSSRVFVCMVYDIFFLLMMYIVFICCF